MLEYKRKPILSEGLKEGPKLPFSGSKHKYKLLLLSAKSNVALDETTRKLKTHLQTHPELNLADVAYTLQVGCHAFEHRRMLVCSDTKDAIAGLNDATRYASAVQPAQKRSIAFLFPGVGDHYPNMGKALYDTEAVFREAVDECCKLLRPLLKRNLYELLYPPTTPINKANTGLNLRQMLGRDKPKETADTSTEPLKQTTIAQPAVFVINYALSQLWQSWGIKPNALVGYSLGEYVAACVAGVLSLKDALTLVSRRAQLIETVAKGSMLAVPLSEAQVKPYLNQQICLAISNSPQNSVLAGPSEAIIALEHRLNAENIAYRHLYTNHAFHSPMMKRIAESFKALVTEISLNRPQLPYLSNVSGTWITPEEATDPAYWSRHLYQTVQFSKNLAELVADPEWVLLEVGPGQSLGTFAKQHPACQKKQWPRILPSLRPVYNQTSDVAFILQKSGQLWLTGLDIDWTKFYGAEQRQQIVLPA